MSEDQPSLPPEELHAQSMVLPMLDCLDPAAPISAMTTLKVSKAKEHAFRENADVLVKASGRMPGVKVFVYHRLEPIQREKEPPGIVEYMIYQEWASVEAFRAQWGSEHLSRFMSSVFDMIVAQPELKFYCDSEEKSVMPQKPKSPIDELRDNVNKMLDNLDPKSPISATVVFKVKKSEEGTFNKNAAALAKATLKLPGVNVFVYEKHQPYKGEAGDDPAAVEYMIYEDWETVEQFRVQWNSEHLKKFQGVIFDLITGPPDVTFYKGWRKRGAAAGAILPKTGQTRCYNARGEEIPCKGTGQDGEYQFGVPSSDPRFSDNGDGTVTDNLTGLVWLKNANLFGEVVRDQAIENARNLASGSCGLTDGSKSGDWRLPNVNELESLLDLNNASGPALPAGHPFTNAQPANYWSSTSVAAFPALGWYVALAVGPPVFDLKFNFMRMWPVRGETRVARTGQEKCWVLDFTAPTGVKEVPCDGTGQDGELRAGAEWPDPRFTDNDDGTVTDNLTGLVWLKNGNPFGTRNWEQGLEDCRNLESGQYGLTDGSKKGDWRMPNINELRSLEDYGEHTPAITKGHPFTNVRHSLCWSSTTVSSAPNLARFLFVGIGSCVWDHKSVLMGVWPVRGGK